MTNPEDFQLLKENMRKRYDSIRTPVHCKCLNQDVYFNSRGFHHLLYDGSGKARTLDQARSRLVLIPLILPVIQNAVNTSYQKIYARKNRKKSSESVMIEMWGLEASVGKSKAKIKVILRREENSKIIFWSVMKIR